MFSMYDSMLVYAYVYVCLYVRAFPSVCVYGVV